MAAKKASPNANDAVLVRIPPDLLGQLDAARKAEDNPPSRPEMIRRILAAWFDQATTESGKGEMT